MDFDIGNKLKELRAEKKLSISELSKISSVSTGLISQIERNLVVPSVINLWRIANALDANINCFFESNKSDNEFLIQKGKHNIVVTHQENSFYKLLSPSKKDRLLDLTEVRLKGNSVYENDLITHEGEECGYVIKGTLTVELGEKKYILNEGDSIYFNSTVPHRYINETKEDCVSIWAMTPLFF